MKKYIKPTYEMEGIETEDIVLASQIQDAGTGTVGGVTGNKGIFESLFENLI